MHAMAVQSSFESILESYVSQYEIHFDERRNLDEYTANEEFKISVNGPKLAHADMVILEVMDLHFKGKACNFFRSSLIEKLALFKRCHHL